MLEYLQQLDQWDWLTLAAIMAAIEVFGGAGYLLWTGIAAALVGLLVWLFPALPLLAQLGLFALFTLATTYLCWSRQRSGHQDNGLPGLNQRGSELLGRTFVLQEAIIDGRGKIRAGDTLWLVTGPDLPAGQSVKVLSQNGVIFSVEPV